MVARKRGKLTAFKKIRKFRHYYYLTLIDTDRSGSAVVWLWIWACCQYGSLHARCAVFGDSKIHIKMKGDMVVRVDSELIARCVGMQHVRRHLPPFRPKVKGQGIYITWTIVVTRASKLGRVT